jgi:flagellar basal body-associated protein FliL
MKPFFGIRETILKQSRRTSLPNEGRRVVQEAHMNHSIHSADRSTHLKIVVVALVAGIAVAAFGISARTGSDYSQTAQVVKAGKPVVVTSSNTSTIR